MNSISCRTLLDTQDLQSSADGFRWQPLLQQQNGQTLSGGVKVGRLARTRPLAPAISMQSLSC